MRSMDDTVEAKVQVFEHPDGGAGRDNHYRGRPRGAT